MTSVRDKNGLRTVPSTLDTRAEVKQQLCREILLMDKNGLGQACTDQQTIPTKTRERASK